MCTWANEAFLCFGSEEEGEKCLFLPRCVCVRCAQSSSSSWCLRRSSTTRHTHSSSVPPLPCFSKCTNEVGRDCGGGGGRRRCNSSTHTHTPASGERRRERDEEEEEEALCDSGLYPSPPALARLAMALQRFPFPPPPRASFPLSLSLYPLVRPLQSVPPPACYLSAFFSLPSLFFSHTHSDSSPFPAEALPMRTFPRQQQSPHPRSTSSYRGVFAMPLREQERGGGRGQRKKEENATHPFLVLFASSASASATSSPYSSRLSYSGPTPPLSSYPLSSSPFPPGGRACVF